jgi:quinolinate synthase
MTMAAEGEIENVHVLSTEGMVDFAKRRRDERKFLVATETGILHRLGKELPDREFHAVSERAVCRYMKMITLEGVRDALRDLKPRVSVQPDVADRARLAIERMVAIA